MKARFGWKELNLFLIQWSNVFSRYFWWLLNATYILHALRWCNCLIFLFFFEKAATIFEIDVAIQKCMILVVTHFSIDLKLFLVNAVNKICDVFDTSTKYAINLYFTKPIFPGGILLIFIYISDIMINNSQKKSFSSLSWSGCKLHDVPFKEQWQFTNMHFVINDQGLLYSNVITKIAIKL